jgi:hypothetical protein
MYAVYDKFNKVVVSRHRSLRNAVKADMKLQRGIGRLRGGSYLPTDVVIVVNNQVQALSDNETEVCLAMYNAQ